MKPKRRFIYPVLTAFFILSAFISIRPALAQVSVDRKTIRLDKPVEILLLQDESGSMDTTKKPSDPKGLRQYAASYLIDQLRIAGPKNEMGFISFSTYPALEEPIGTAFDQILKNAKKGRPEITAEQRNRATCYNSLEAVPFYMYTDILRVLQAAHKMLDNKKNSQKTKHVILLTDGEQDPWPGDPDRSDITKQYLEKIKGIPCSKRYGAGEKWMKRLQSLDNRLINKELRSFRKNGWRIHSIGFANADQDMLKRISKASRGKWDPNVKDVPQLESILRNVIPLPENVIEIFADTLCGMTLIKRPVKIQKNLKAVQFAFSLVRMYENTDFRISPKDLTMEIKKPNGTVVSSAQTNSSFQFYVGKRNELFRISYFQEQPLAGRWEIKIKIHKRMPKMLCGDATVLGRRVQDLEVEISPEGPHQPGQQVNVKIGLKDEETNFLTLSSVSGDFPERGSKVTFKPIDNEKAQFSTVLTMPDQPGKYELSLKLRDAGHSKNRPITPDGIVFTVTPPVPCKLILRKGQLDNLVLGDESYEVNREIEVELQGCASTNFIAEIPELKIGSDNETSVLPSHWFDIQPMEGTLHNGTPTALKISVHLPPQCSLPAHVRYGALYKGDLKIFVSGSENDDAVLTIPMGVQIDIPRFTINGFDQDFTPDFSTPEGQTLAPEISARFNWSRYSTLEVPIEIGTTSIKNQTVYLTLPSNLINENGTRVLNRVAMGFDTSDFKPSETAARFRGETQKTSPQSDRPEAPVENGNTETNSNDETAPSELIRLGGEAVVSPQNTASGKLTFELLPDVRRIPAGIYTGDIRLHGAEGSCMRTLIVPIELLIPECPIKCWLWYVFCGIIALGFLLIVIFLGRIKKAASNKRAELKGAKDEEQNLIETGMTPETLIIVDLSHLPSSGATLRSLLSSQKSLNYSYDVFFQSVLEKFTGVSVLKEGDDVKIEVAAKPGMPTPNISLLDGSLGRLSGPATIGIVEHIQIGIDRDTYVYRVKEDMGNNTLKVRLDPDAMIDQDNGGTVPTHMKLKSLKREILELEKEGSFGHQVFHGPFSTRIIITFFMTLILSAAIWLIGRPFI